MIHFFCFLTDKKIVISDFTQEKIKEKFGYRYEILTSIKEKTSLEVVKGRIQRSYPGYIIEEYFKKSYTLSEESKKKISDSKLGKPRDDVTKAKISSALKGKSNFQGKTHSPETRAKMAERKAGNSHTKNYVWAHDPRGDTEVRVKDIKLIPNGFSKGRDYFSTEAGLYHFDISRQQKL